MEMAMGFEEIHERLSKMAEDKGKIAKSVIPDVESQRIDVGYLIEVMKEWEELHDVAIQAFTLHKKVMLMPDC